MNSKKMINSLLYLMVVILVIKNGMIFFSNSKNEGMVVENVKLLKVGKPAVEINLSEIKPPCALFFWSLSCPPCIFELNRIERAIEAKEILPSKVVAINISDSPEDIVMGMAKNGWTFPVYLDVTKALIKKLNVQATPTVIYLDKDSKISTVSTGVSPLAIYRLKKM